MIIGAAPRQGLNALLSRGPATPSIAMSGEAAEALQAQGFPRRLAARRTRRIRVRRRHTAESSNAPLAGAREMAPAVDRNRLARHPAGAV